MGLKLEEGEREASESLCVREMERKSVERERGEGDKREQGD